MLRNWTTHATYQDLVRTELSRMSPQEKSRLPLFHKSLTKLFLLNLDPLLPILKPLYSASGRPSLNQCEILRSLVFMLDYKRYSITDWAKLTAIDPLVRLLCGFSSQHVPRVASYYDFLTRLWLSPRKHIHKVLRFPFRKPSKRYKANQKMPCKHAGSVTRLVEKAIHGRLPDMRPECLLQKFLSLCLVEPSAKLGLLGDVKALSLTFDGSPYYAGSSSYGVKVCSCRQLGIYDCQCQRRYSDPDARWGWDSYREQYFYGDTLFNVVASDSPYDLPIYIRSVQASRHDSVTTIFALRDVLQLFPNFKLSHLIADGAMDSYAIYKLLSHHAILPFIPLDKSAKFPKKDLPKDVSGFTEQGHPLCPRGFAYTYWGRTRNRLKYRCPLAVKEGRRPINWFCSCKTTSNYGKTLYIKPEDDPRLFPPVPRDTLLFKSIFKRRTSVERGNKRIFEDYRVEGYRSRSKKLRFALAAFAVANIHLDAWVKHLDIRPEHFNLAV